MLLIYGWLLSLVGGVQAFKYAGSLERFIFELSAIEQSGVIILLIMPGGISFQLVNKLLNRVLKTKADFEHKSSVK